MKKISTGFLLLIVTFAFSSYAQAENDSASISLDAQTNISTTREKGDDHNGWRDTSGNGGIKAFFRFNNEDRKNDDNPNREEMRERMESQDGSKNHLGWEMRMKAHKQFAISIERLEKIIERIETRIEKIKGEGIDTATATSFVVKAKADITLAKSYTASANAIIQANLTSKSDMTEEERAQIKDLLGKAKVSLKSSWTNLFEAVKEIKKASIKVEASAKTDIQ